MKSLSVKWGVILIIGLTICGYAELCNAQNWVLWAYTKTSDGKNWQGENWQILEAFPSYELCMKAWDRSVSLGILNATKVGKGTFVITDKGYTHLMEFKCLPDTVDPRK